MFHDEDDDETEILFDGSAGKVTWLPGGPNPPISNNSGPMPFPVEEGSTVDFFYDMLDAGPLPRLPLKFLGTTGDTIFLLEPHSEWSSPRQDEFLFANWRTRASQNAGLVIVGTIDMTEEG